MAHGAEHYRHEALYLALSWLRHRGAALQPCRMLIATDDPATFTRVLGEQPDIAFLPLDAARLLAWRGGADGYVHRIKPQLIAFAAAEVSAGPADALLFVDSDTAFLANPAPLFDAALAGQAVLHAREGTIEGNRSHSRSQARLFAMSQKVLFDYGGQLRRRLAPGLPLWNSGAVGLRGDRVAGVMAETLALTDLICAEMALPAAEQVALSAVLDARGLPVMAAENQLLHYHVFKEFRADIAAFLARHAGASPQEWVNSSALIDPLLRIQPKLAFNRLPKWRRQLKKHLGRGWAPLPYPWAE
jgi:hypothetical protein